MLRLVSISSARLRVGVFRAAVAGATRFGVDREHAPTQHRYKALRFSSSDTPHNSRRWTTPALNDSEAWQQAVKPAFLTFLKLQKHLMVPLKFTVPHGDKTWPEAAWGYPLGKHATWLRKQWREGGGCIDPTQLQELEDMGFAWDRSQYKWDRFVLPALRRFYDLNGHTDVPLSYRIPKGSPEWPEHLWGHHLGRKVAHMRNREDFATQLEADKNEMERLNFCHDSTLFVRNWREKVVPALRVFRQEFGHCDVENPFVVPSQFPWPEAAWGMRLGKTVQQIRCGKLRLNGDKHELEELGFAWNHAESEWSERIMPAFEIFRRLNGHCRVPGAFVVPPDENWPTRLWGLKLGAIVHEIRGQDNYYAAQVSHNKARLEELGFVWNVSESKWNERILPALETFHLLKAHCRVPNSFVVPSDENWPTPSWGLRLGKVVKWIRSEGCYSTQVSRDQARLEKLGFAWDFYEAEWSERILPALEAFHKVHGHCRVVVSFVVPSEATWPKQAHDLKLGTTVRTIRKNASYFDRIARAMDSLEAIEFDSKIAVSKWEERVEPILATFKQLHGHRNVPRDFVVPSNALWQQKDWGIQLGKLEPR
ncbi:hypothetical protein PF005_g10559 [Phytophthora fragariae]|uniref:Helicase-associated domain-containing protein n=1 Tax=Phytophthora fragariae TaxID=53985 RepID=A0A6A4DTL0_9STRA|nr:hypothetical protein PF003_g38384 [Phytophthora fragariae]KAE8938200.1 hypothetical protein PF009_g11920 [Phytophthora fragariae]KAE9008579.1 hypothetical protein PF011_g10657 [Phytophthora fragariae]KAE9112972.1 hypothetical protein PF007_g10900 [Phytophthora fragariae]KAE9145650.1 hypothetical protein PF006_g9530 [Phytophthora fragariae]